MKKIQKIRSFDEGKKFQVGCTTFCLKNGKLFCKGQHVDRVEIDPRGQSVKLINSNNNRIVALETDDDSTWQRGLEYISALYHNQIIATSNPIVVAISLPKPNNNNVLEICRELGLPAD